MTIQGFQDFQEGTIWQSALAFNFSQSLGPGVSHTWPDAPATSVVCSNWQATQLHCSSTSSLDVVVRWWQFADATFPLGERRFTHYGTWADSFVTVSNLGPYLTVSATKDAVGTNTVSVTGTFTNRPLGPFQPRSSAPMLLEDFQTVGAGATANWTADYLYSGPAMWLLAAISGSGAWEADLTCFTAGGTSIHLARLYNTAVVTQAFNVSVMVPPRPLRLSITNNGGAGQLFTASVTPDLFR